MNSFMPVRYKVKKLHNLEGERRRSRGPHRGGTH
jgi:hypothetical protein